MDPNMTLGFQYSVMDSLLGNCPEISRKLPVECNMGRKFGMDRNGNESAANEQFRCWEVAGKLLGNCSGTASGRQYRWKFDNQSEGK